MGTTGNFLFQGTPPSDFTNVTDTNQSMPEWWQDAAQGLIAQSSAIAGQPYNPYPGPTVAPLDPLQNQAYNESTGYTSQVNSALSDANNNIGAATQNGLNGLNQNSLNSYMNPYTSDVTNSIAQLGEQNLVNNLLPAVNSTFTGSGQFGSSQNANFTQQALLNEEQNVSQQQSAALQSGFNNAVGATETGNAQAIAGGTAQGNLATQTGQENRSQEAWQNELGGQNQQQAQNNLNAAQTAFNNQTNYPYEQANFLNGIIHGFQPSAQSTTTGTSPLNNSSNSLSGLSSVAGAGANAAGALSTLFKKGGIAKHKKVKYAYRKRK